MTTNSHTEARATGPLLPGSFQVDGRSVPDLYEEAVRMARDVKFFGTEGPPSDWSAFFRSSPGGGIPSFPEGEYPPQLALFLTFLHLFRHVQNDLNDLVGAHLRFFYQKVLGFSPEAARPGKLYVFPEPAPKITKIVIPAGHRLTAGKNASGAAVTYITDRDATVTQAALTGIFSVFCPETPGEKIRASIKPVNNSDIWHPFKPGHAEKETEAGFAVASPLLTLKEGTRTISVILSGITAPADAGFTAKFSASRFRALLTTRDGWISLPLSDETGAGPETLSFVIQLNDTFPAVTPYDPEVHGPAFGDTRWPVLKIVLEEAETGLYSLLRQTGFGKIRLKVKAGGISSLHLRNDYGDLDPNRAAQPFGPFPVKGANFYVGLDELRFKPLTVLELTFQWQGLPKDFKNYYEGYKGETNSLVAEKSDFRVTAKIRTGNDWKVVKGKGGDGSFPIFENPVSLPVAGHFTGAPGSLKEHVTGGQIGLSLSSPEQAFGHSLYPILFSKASMLQARGTQALLPNEPYTPVIESVRLSYEAEEEADTQTSFFHVTPFGAGPVGLSGETRPGGIPLVAGDLADSGQLYLGLSRLELPQQLSLFIKMEEEGTGNHAPVSFSYLGPESWVHFSNEQVLADTTMGLRQTGSLTLNLPADMSDANPVMPPGACWLKISTSSGAANFGLISAVLPNAVICTEQPAAGLPNGAPLPPGSVKSFDPPLPGIRKIGQPFPSFGGRPAERTEEWYTRVSGHLRHKGRAVSVWDYERLISGEFPGISQVKCITPSQDSRVSPGELLIILVPKVSPSDTRRLFRPEVGSGTLEAVGRYVDSIKSPHVRATISNARFVEIRVVARVCFAGQTDEGHSLRQLQEELLAFFSPWAFHEHVTIELGGRLHRSSVIRFIETRPYVRFIDRIYLEKNGEKFDEREEIHLDRQSVIVSAERHAIEPVREGSVPFQKYRGIGQMILDINFEVQ